MNKNIVAEIIEKSDFEYNVDSIEETREGMILVYVSDNFIEAKIVITTHLSVYVVFESPLLHVDDSDLQFYEDVHNLAYLVRDWINL